MFSHAALLLLAPAALAASTLNCRAAAIRCPIVFDGRDFNLASGGGWNPYNPDYVKGAGLLWSDIILLPQAAPPSRFDSGDNKRPLEVTISDKSIFMNQRGFRRAGLQFAKDANTGSPAATGVKTLHFSVRQDAARPLNLTHEYLNVWHETAAYDANQFNFQTGTIIGQTGLPKNTFKLLDRNNQLVWSTPMATDGSWQNFALTLDFSANTIQVWYSAGDAALVKQGGATSANLAGNGQYQIGILKKPTGTSDVVNSGYQSSNLNEGQIYGGIFIEDSANGSEARSQRRNADDAIERRPQVLTLGTLLGLALDIGQLRRPPELLLRIGGRGAEEPSRDPSAVCRGRQSHRPICNVGDHGDVDAVHLHVGMPVPGKILNQPNGAITCRPDDFIRLHFLAAEAKSHCPPPTLRSLHCAANGAAAQGVHGARIAAVIGARHDQVKVVGLEPRVEQPYLGAAGREAVYDKPAVGTVLGLVAAGDVARLVSKGRRASTGGGQGLANCMGLADPRQRTVRKHNDRCVASLVQGVDEGSEVGRDGRRGPVIVD
ncbi:uncharacterized protein ColSpa_00610 [Colletotrichum spaethianum]|uniref:Glycoside hydrolase 131 catalytic N-terminal domain-containing protein n=1 Tax=Colletotrichum spaethianum TaxID=700344 RepID=A0AA37P6T1_9PEZI|nr:uncharacterized protein ColSpa_00610 [Colletotrichum spaethianum]GKT40429.1 hypothetical protein ColSpa_00610 [Colletotrichum spaethianum]